MPLIPSPESPKEYGRYPDEDYRPDQPAQQLRLIVVILRKIIDPLARCGIKR